MHTNEFGLSDWISKGLLYSVFCILELVHHLCMEMFIRIMYLCMQV